MAKRLFVAIKLPSEIKAILSKQQARLIGDLHLTKRENFHITVLFLGEVAEIHLDEIIKKLEEIAKNTKSFSFIFDNIILAPPKKPRTMVWVTLKENKKYDKLVLNVYSKLKKYTKEKLRTKRIPHVTLAKFPETEKIKLPKLNFSKNISFSATAIHLFESKPTENFSEYTHLKQIDLS